MQMRCEIPKGSDVFFWHKHLNFYGISVSFLWHKHFLWQKHISFQAVGDST